MGHHCESYTYCGTVEVYYQKEKKSTLIYIINKRERRTGCNCVQQVLHARATQMSERVVAHRSSTMAAGGHSHHEAVLRHGER